MTANPENPFAKATSLPEVVGQVAGAVAMCWIPRPTGVFDAEMASQLVSAAMARIRELSKVDESEDDW